jgi:hypothetical protein
MTSVNTRNANYQKRWDFGGAALPSEWSITALGAGMAVAVTGGALTITTGTTPSAETIVRCSKAVSLKFIARFIAMLSQRIAEQNFYLEVLNEAGTTYARWNLDGTTATSAKVESANQNVANTPVTVTVPTTASFDVFEIYGEIEQVLFSASNANTNAVKGGLSMFDRNVPEPGESYYLQIRAVNTAIGPASSTTFSVDAVLVEDLEMVGVEILRAAGDAHPAASMPVRATGGTLDTVASVTGVGTVTTVTGLTTCTTVTTAYTAAKTTRYSDTSAQLAANAAFTGTGRDTGSTMNYDRFRTFVNVASSSGTLYIEQSSDNVTFYVTDSVAVTAGTPRTDEFKIVMRYVRLRYVNGATATTTALKIDSLVLGS